MVTHIVTHTVTQIVTHGSRTVSPPDESHKTQIFFFFNKQTKQNKKQKKAGWAK